MSTARDLMITALDVRPSRPVERGGLSLALAGAELIDLLAAEAIELDVDRIRPRPKSILSDPLLDQAAEALVREAPYESVEEWLWRRGRDLAATYAAAVIDEGLLASKGKRMPFGHGGAPELADSPERSAAAARWAADEPVVATLGAAAGIRQEAPGNGQSADPAVVTVLAAVDDATVELEAVRQRRGIEQAAFDNIWRGF
ncbi:GPP34 family phosphoprotein [Embleya sp. NPDC056575]|uniref:GOLPH3/VPS74 family protein n=1 Tax=unclassified Embleya TaxID=2699296 RepID=UPI00369C35A5